MQAPKINIQFIEKANNAVTRANRGIVALLVADAPLQDESNPISVVTASDIPKGLSDTTVDQIKLALKGYEGISPTKIIVYCMGQLQQKTKDELQEMSVPDILTLAEENGYTMQSTEATALEEIATEFMEQQSEGNVANITAALEAFETISFSYMVIPNVETSGVKEKVIEWIKEQRKSIKVKAVLPNVEADTEGIINYVVNKNVVAEKTRSNGEEIVTEIEYTAEQFCARIAGLIAATPITYSATYAPLSDVVDCEKIKDKDKAVDEGKFIIFYDGEKIKTSRAVNSLQSTTDEKGEDFKKVRIVEIMDIIHDDIKKWTEDSYLGKYPNTYDNKCILISAIDEYLNELERNQMISSHTVEIDIDAQREYLKSKGKDVTNMTDQEILEALTGSNVFITGTISIVDTIEDLNWKIYM